LIFLVRVGAVVVRAGWLVRASDACPVRWWVLRVGGAVVRGVFGAGYACVVSRIG
jgi:hypothetical protein